MGVNKPRVSLGVSIGDHECCIASMGWSFDARNAGYTAAPVPSTIENSEEFRVNTGSYITSNTKPGPNENSID